MLYTGTFKTKKDEEIEVRLTTNNDTTVEQELTFVDDAPVIISQTSSDGLFSPIKSRSCTITIVSKEDYFDLYSASPMGTLVEVINNDTGRYLFYGYLTPYQYNQDYLYLNEIELEAVDALSVLQYYKYSQYQFLKSVAEDHWTSDLLPNKTTKIKLAIIYILTRFLHYDQVYCTPYLDRAVESNVPFDTEVIASAVFDDEEEDKDNSLTMYEVLEEIGKFFNCTFVPYGKNIYIISYNIINCLCYIGEPTEFFSLVDNSRVFYTNTIKTIGLSDYAGSEQNVELDDVYNPIVVKADIDTVDDDYFFKTIESEVKDMTQVYEIAQAIVNQKGKTQYTCFSILYQPKASSLIGTDGNTFWYYTGYSNYNPNTPGTLTYNFNTSLNWDTRHIFPFYEEGGVFYSSTLNNIVLQCAMPAKYFNYEGGTVPYKANFTDRIAFFPQLQWVTEYLKQLNADLSLPDTIEMRYNGNDPNGYYSTKWNEWYDNYFGGSNIVLTGTYSFVNPYATGTPIYNPKGTLNFAPKYLPDRHEYYQYKHYLYITCDLFFDKHGISQNDVTYNIWNYTDNAYFPYYTPLADMGVSPVTLGSRSKNHQDYGRGWPMLKVRLSIEELTTHDGYYVNKTKYWNGSQWTTTNSTFYLNFHSTNNNDSNEKLVYVGKNSVVPNFDYEDQINVEGYAIPISNSQMIYGSVKLEVYMPKVLWQNNMFIKDGSAQNAWCKFDYTKTPPVIYMENLKLGFKSVDNSVDWIMKAQKTDDESKKDIKYVESRPFVVGNEVSREYSTELKLNTYRNEKPLAKSSVEVAILNTDPQYDLEYKHPTGFAHIIQPTDQEHTLESIVHTNQEESVRDVLSEHYLYRPKKIYNCEVKDYYMPFMGVTVNALSTDTYMMVDEQEYNVKSNVNTLKLIEY